MSGLVTRRISSGDIRSKYKKNKRSIIYENDDSFMLKFDCQTSNDGSVENDERSRRYRQPNDDHIQRSFFLKFKNENLKLNSKLLN
jgi:hypothetical protein